METCCDYLDREKMYVSTDEAKLKSKLLQYKEEFPDQVDILKTPEENQGTLYCTVPPSWLKIRPVKNRNYTEEQKAEMAKRFRKVNVPDEV